MYLYGVPCCSLILCIAGGCWWWQKKKAAWFGVGKNNERKPLLSDGKGKRQVSNVIAKFESQEAANKKASSKGKEPVSQVKGNSSSGLGLFSRAKKKKVVPLDTRPEKTKPVDRCQVCRKTFSSKAADIVHFQDQKVHLSCFLCCDCQINLQHHEHKTVQQYSANVRVKFQCRNCCEQFNGKPQQHSHESAVKHKLGPVVIEDHEQGDTKETLEKIGDDLTEAVFFMHPKCCVCGGDFYNKTMARETKGNWRYHQECWDSGVPTMLDEMKACTKLLPAASAKYLPEQLIVQLYCPLEITTATTSTNTYKKKGIDSKILTTLYFVWENKEAHAKELSKVHKKDPMVAVPYILDDQAPANPNFVPQVHTATVQQSKRQRQAQSTTAKTLTLPANNMGVDKFQLRLLAEDEVAPRPPTMVEPVSIVNVEGASVSPDSKGDSNRGDGDTNMTDTSEGSGAQKKQFLSAKLGFLKFGLQYIVSLRIPLEEDKATRDNVEPTDYDDKVTIDRGSQVNFAKAILSVTIQE